MVDILEKLVSASVIGRLPIFFHDQTIILKDCELYEKGHSLGGAVIALPPITQFRGPCAKQITELIAFTHTAPPDSLWFFNA